MDLEGGRGQCVKLKCYCLTLLLLSSSTLHQSAMQCDACLSLCAPACLTPFAMAMAWWQGLMSLFTCQSHGKNQTKTKMDWRLERRMDACCSSSTLEDWRWGSVMHGPWFCSASKACQGTTRGEEPFHYSSIRELYLSPLFLYHTCLWGCLFACLPLSISSSQRWTVFFFFGANQRWTEAAGCGSMRIQKLTACSYFRERSVRPSLRESRMYCMRPWINRHCVCIDDGNQSAWESYVCSRHAANQLHKANADLRRLQPLCIYSYISSYAMHHGVMPSLVC